MSDSNAMSIVMTAAYLETQACLEPQARENFRVSHAKAKAYSNQEVVADFEEEDNRGIISRRFMATQPDNARFDAGFWGNTSGGGRQTHNGSKAKGQYRPWQH